MPLATAPNSGVPLSAQRRRAAGIMFTTADGKALFVKRAGDVDHVGEWAFPGGGVKDGEEPEHAARRETIEEIGPLPRWDIDLIDDIASDEGVDYSTYEAEVEEFEPRLNGEHDAFIWAPINTPPQPLHPGVYRLLQARTVDPQQLTSGGWGHDAALENLITEFKFDRMRDPSAREIAGLWAKTRPDLPVRRHVTTLGLDWSRWPEWCREENSRAGKRPKPAGRKAKAAGREVGTDSALRLALDRESVREFDRDGRLRVARAHISKANVCPYKGSEIPDYEKLGLDPDRIYNLLRDPEELAKGAATFNGLPVLRNHIPVSAEDHQPYDVVGATGTNAEMVGPYLDNSLSIWAKDAIDGIESEEKRELSCGYHYRADMTPGVYDGREYDGVMRDIVGNHVALVEDGRAGPDVVVGDSSEGLMDNRGLAKKLNALSARQVSIGALTTFIKPKLAHDAKLDLGSVFDGIKVGTDFKNQKTKIAERLRTQAKGKLAKDASLDDVEKVLDMLDTHEIEASEGTDESVSKEQHNAMAAAAHGNSNLDIPKKVGEEFLDKDRGKSFDAEPVLSFLREKGMSEDDISHISGLFPKPALDADDEPETEEEKKKREEAEKKAAETARATAEAAKAADMSKDKQVTKTAMDAAIKAATDATAKSVRDSVLKTQHELREALAEVRPWVGDLPPSLAFDSAEQVRRHALEMLAVPNAKTMHPDALSAVLNVQPKPGARPADQVRERSIGMDAVASKNFAERFPDAGRIRRV